MAEIIPIHQHKENFNEAVKNLSNLCKEDLQSINTLILEKKVYRSYKYLLINYI